MEQLVNTTFYTKIPKFFRKFLHKDKITALRVKEEIESKYSFAYDAFRGVFGDYGWIDRDLMISQKTVSTDINQENIIELTRTLANYSFVLDIVRVDNTYKVMMRPNDNISKYLRTKTLSYNEANHTLIMQQIAPEKSFIMD